MNRPLSAALPLLGAALLSGCLRTSEVTLNVLIREPTLANVEAFPVRLIIDMGFDNNRELHICEWPGGFLETSVSANTYDKCPEPLTIEAVLLPLAATCDDGAFGFTTDWHEPGNVIYGRGSVDVFESGACNTLEDRLLSIDVANE